MILSFGLKFIGYLGSFSKVFDSKWLDFVCYSDDKLLNLDLYTLIQMLDNIEN